MKILILELIDSDIFITYPAFISAMTPGKALFRLSKIKLIQYWRETSIISTMQIQYPLDHRHQLTCGQIKTPLVTEPTSEYQRGLPF